MQKTQVPAGLLPARITAGRPGVALYRPNRALVASSANGGHRIMLDGGNSAGGGTGGVVRLAHSRPGPPRQPQQPSGSVILLDLSQATAEQQAAGATGNSEVLSNFLSASAAGVGGAVDSAGNVTTLQRLGGYLSY
jgi:hypothetical protein